MASSIAAQLQALPQQIARCGPPAAHRQSTRPIHAAARHQKQRRQVSAASAEAASAVGAAVSALQATPAAALPQLAADLAAAVDEAPIWTLDQAVGLVFGGLLLLLYLSSSQVDRFVAKQQRRQLGLCEECGGLYEPSSCTQKSCPFRTQ